MAKAWWLLAVVGCACSHPDDAADEPLVASAYFDFTLSEPEGERSCVSAAPTAYHVGSEKDPLTQGNDRVLCSIHSTEKDSWFSGSLDGVAVGGFNVVFQISNQNELLIEMASDLTGTIELDAALSADCAPLFTATINDAVSAEFDCPLLADPNDPTSGCGVRGTVNFWNCELE